MFTTYTTACSRRCRESKSAPGRSRYSRRVSSTTYVSCLKAREYPSLKSRMDAPCPTPPHSAKIESPFPQYSLGNRPVPCHNLSTREDFTHVHTRRSLLPRPHPGHLHPLAPRSTRIELWLSPNLSTPSPVLTQPMVGQPDGTLSLTISTAGLPEALYYGYRAWGPNWPYDPA